MKLALVKDNPDPLPPRSLKGVLRDHAPRPLLRAAKRGTQLPSDLKTSMFLTPSLRAVRGLTMVAPASLVALGEQVIEVLDQKIPGDLVECGVWKGGSSFLMADILRRRGVRDRKVWMFDSFEGLPPPSELDGEKALEYTSDPTDPHYFDNCAANMAEVEQSASHLGLTPWVQLVQGWFEESLPVTKDRIGAIALLRLDGDWYESTLVALEHLFDQVSPGGFIVIDDYHSWEGCAIAVHEFLASRKLGTPITTVSDEWGSHSAFFRKPQG